MIATVSSGAIPKHEAALFNFIIAQCLPIEQVKAIMEQKSRWTEHVAPSGHKYYYNAETKQSTYIKPAYLADVSICSPPSIQTLTPVDRPFSNPTFARGFRQSAVAASNADHEGHRFRQASHPREHRNNTRVDRPKSKHALPDSSWFLIKTKLGRRFVYNPDTHESFWKLPNEIIGHVVEFDIQERKKKIENDQAVQSAITAEKSKAEAAENNVHQLLESEEVPRLPVVVAAVADKAHDYDRDEYEEVEVTDDEEIQEESDTNEPGDDEPAPEEFNEDDMAFQLAQLGQTYQLDSGEYGHGDGGEYDEEWEAGAEGLPLTEDEANASFKELLEDFNIDPFTTWDKIINDGYIIEDNRYTLLPNMKSRKSVFVDWSIAKIERLKEQRANERKANPQIPYLTFLQKHATPKLFWPEFRRKFRRELELTNIRMSDKDREKLYREHIKRITKIPEPELRTDLDKLLSSIPASSTWNSTTSLDHGLPPQLLSDLRYISLQPDLRDRIILAYLRRLPKAAEAAAQHVGERVEQLVAHKKREAALQERRFQVDHEKKLSQRALASGRNELAAAALELRQATNVSKKSLFEALSYKDGRTKAPTSPTEARVNSE